VPGWAALIFVILFIGGIQLTVVGILGLYINVIYQEVKGRPLFVIESIKSANETINPLYFRTNKFKFEAPDD
jgi:dolichol-phosphate mannosyltransferase